jgi:TonB-dependent SusC/RagA subfamily outer membrane receptor
VSKHLSHRASAALAALSLVTSLGCSHSSKDTTASTPDYSGSPSANNEGRTLEDMFAGRFPGVSVQRSDGGGLLILIRGGNNSFYGSNEPLYVVDDTPLEPGHHGIVFLNPNDIAKIEVLKNPADIGIYGVRGGNGVIKITTKKPGRR